MVDQSNTSLMLLKSDRKAGAAIRSNRVRPHTQTKGAQLLFQTQKPNYMSPSGRSTFLLVDHCFQNLNIILLAIINFHPQ